MEATSPDHDRDTGEHDRETTVTVVHPDALQDAIERLRLQGAVFLRAE
ncbi:MAG: hypothetical protein ABI873_06715 [Marmoricola sp.]